MVGTFSELRQQGLAKAACFTKAASSGVALSPSDLEAINGFALFPHSSESIYSRKVLLAHNAVDRDRERFQESLLDDFAALLPGKSFLWAHNRRGYTPYGLWFKAETEAITRVWSLGWLKGCQFKLTCPVSSARRSGRPALSRAGAEDRDVPCL